MVLTACSVLRPALLITRPPRSGAKNHTALSQTFGLWVVYCTKWRRSDPPSNHLIWKVFLKKLLKLNTPHCLTAIQKNLEKSSIWCFSPCQKNVQHVTSFLAFIRSSFKQTSSACTIQTLLERCDSSTNWPRVATTSILTKKIPQVKVLLLTPLKCPAFSNNSSKSYRRQTTRAQMTAAWTLSHHARETRSVLNTMTRRLPQKAIEDRFLMLVLA